MLVILIDNDYLCDMAKWDDKHMYNWIGWMRSLYDLPKKVHQWSINEIEPHRFIVFVLNTLVLYPLCYTALSLMLIPQTFEWLMRNIGDEVNDLGKGRSEGIKHNIKEFTYVMIALFILIPYTVTWGIPKLIEEIKQRRVEKRLQKQAEELRQARRWENIRDSVNRSREELERQQRIIREWRIDIERKEDFRPKKQIKHHQFGDTPKIRIFTRDEQALRRRLSRRDRTTRYNRGNE